MQEIERAFLLGAGVMATGALLGVMLNKGGDVAEMLNGMLRAGGRLVQATDSGAIAQAS